MEALILINTEFTGVIRNLLQQILGKLFSKKHWLLIPAIRAVSSLITIAILTKYMSKSIIKYSSYIFIAIFLVNLCLEHTKKKDKDK